MRTSGRMPYITPRQIATESSSTPKSVMKTIVGGYFCVPSFAAQAWTGTADNSTTSARIEITARNTSPQQRNEEFIPSFLGLESVVSRPMSRVRPPTCHKEVDGAPAFILPEYVFNFNQSSKETGIC